MTTVNLAIIGTGLIGSIYARIAHEMVGVNLVAVHDARADKAGAIAKQFNTKAYFDDYATLFQAHSELDGVLVCTPVAYHLEPALATLNAGKHLLIQKPLASNLQDARLIADRARSAQCIAMMSYSLRFDPRYVTMKQAVQSGRIGKVIHLYAQRNPSLDAYERIGGRVSLPFWVSVHDIDMLRWITDSEIKQVFVSANHIGFEPAQHTRAILANFVFENDAIAVLENAWRATSTSNPQLSVSSFQVHGTRGSIQIRSTETGIQIVEDGIMSTPDTFNLPEVMGEVGGLYRHEIATFVRSIRENSPSPIPMREGVHGVVVAEAIEESIRTGLPVTPVYPIVNFQEANNDI